MATELQRQVVALKKQHVQAQSIERGAPSIFLPAKEAALVDVNAVHEAAVEGLRVLSQYDDRFTLYSRTLLHASSVDLQRELKTKEENQKLDKEIGELLDLLALWIFEPNSHLVLEYLIRRYRVHEFNVDNLLRSILVAHDTKVFGKVVQLCSLLDTPWVFLSGVKETGTPLPRSILVKRLLKSPWLLEVVSDSTMKILTLLGIRKSDGSISISNLQGGEKMIAFLTSLVVESAEQVAFNDSNMRNIYVYLIEGLKTKRKESMTNKQLQLLYDWKNSCCLIISQLSRKTEFGESLRKAFSKALSTALIYEKEQELTAASDALATNIVITVAILAQFSQLYASSKLLISLFKSSENIQSSEETEWFFQKIAILQTLNTAPLLLSISESIFDHLIEHSTKQNEAEFQQLQYYLQSIIRLKLITGKTVVVFLAKIFNNAADLSPSTSSFHTLVRFISSQMPVEFESTLSNFLKSNEAISKRSSNLKAFLSIAFANVLKDTSLLSGDSLFVSLNSPIKELRLSAIEKYSKLAIEDISNISPNEMGLAEAAFSNLEDYDIDIALVIWQQSIFNILSNCISADRLINSIRKAWSWWVKNFAQGQTKALKILLAILQSIVNVKFFDSLVSNTQTSDEVSGFLLKIIVWSMYQPSDSEQEGISALRVAAYIVSSKLSDRIASFSGLKVSKLSDSNKLVELFQANIISNVVKNSEKVLCNLKYLLDSSETDTVANAQWIATRIRFVSCLLQGLKQAKRDDLEKSIFISTVCPFIVRQLQSQHSSVVSSALKLIISDHSKDIAADLLVDFDQKSLLEVFTTPLEEASTSVQLLIKALGSAHVITSDFIDEIFEQLTKFESLALMFRILLASDGLKDSGFLQAAALCSTDQILKYKFDNQIASKENSVALFSLLVALYKLSSFDRVVKKQAMGVLRTLCHTINKTMISIDLSKASKSTKEIFGTSVQLDGAYLQDLLQTLVTREQSIYDDSSNVTISFTTFLQKNSSSSKLFLDFLWLGISTSEWRNLKFASFLIELAGGVVESKYWQVVKNLIECNDLASGSNESESFLKKLFDLISISFVHFEPNVKADVVDFVVKLTEDNSKKSLRRACLELVTKANFNLAAKDSIDRLYTVLLSIQAENGGDILLSNAIASLIVDPMVSIQQLYTSLRMASSANDSATVVQSNKSNGGRDIDEDEADASSLPLGNVSILQKVIYLAEAAVLAITAHKDIHPSSWSSLLALLFDALELLGQSRAQSIISIDYLKSSLMDHICKVLNEILRRGHFKQLLASDASTPTKKRGSKATERATSSLPSYNSGRVAQDISSIMYCLGSVRSASIYTSAFGALKVLLNLEPSQVFSAVDVLGALLAKSTHSFVFAKEKLLMGTMNILFEIVQEANLNDKSLVISIQNLVQSLCMQFPSTLQIHRLTLLRAAMKSNGANSTVAAIIIHTMLLHTVHLYNRSASNYKETLNDQVLLSRAAQRRAKRVLLTTESEEFFQAAVTFFLELSVRDEISVLAEMLRHAKALVDFSLGSEVDEDAGIDIMSCLDYIRKLSADSSKTGDELEDRQGQAATLAAIQFEFILEAMENQSFHLKQAKEIQHGGDLCDSQGKMLEIAELSLQICSDTEDLRQTLHSKTMRMRLENKDYIVSAASLSCIYRDLAINILNGLQNLLDNASFLTIVQELLDHEVVSIRQRAIVFLKDRLQLLVSDKNQQSVDYELFLELFARMRVIVSSFCGSIETKSGSELLNSSEASVVSVAMAQSAVMCIDVLVISLGKSKYWIDPIKDLLTEFLSVLSSLYKRSSGKSSVENFKHNALETRKLLGSIVLSCASACHVLGAAAFPYFKQFIDQITSMLKNETDNWMNPEKREVLLTSDRRAHTLFFRSMISSITIVINSIPQFCHPLISSIVPILLDSYSCFGLDSNSRDLKGIQEDADICLNSISSSIPARLAIPAFHACISNCLSHGHVAALRIGILLNRIVQNCDRTSILSNLSKLLHLSLEVLDYRRIQSINFEKKEMPDSNYFPVLKEIESTGCDCIVEICLKLTENELKTLVLKIIDWRGQLNDKKDKNVQAKLIRDSSFYHVLLSLLSRLKFLFFSTAAMAWSDALLDLSENKMELNSLFDISSKDGSSKKRKRLSDAFNQLSPTLKEQVKTRFEIVAHILQIMRELSDTTSAEFMNDKRFEDAYPVALAFISERVAFDSDDSYLSFVEDNVSNTLSHLCLAVGKDLLWKPLNHQLLIQTRSPLAVVRKASICALGHLFQKIGEDYLLLLPECLQFLSELLEDDDTDVLKATRETVSVIEELSGEKLDSYLS